jgi:antibiotic biosynthesis monooxygenase (ABM) superfamily enzyme
VSESVTVVVTRKVKPGREEAYEAWLGRLVADVSAKLPGYMGADFQRPPDGSREYTSVFRFDSVEHLRRFEGSQLRADALKEVADLVEADAVWDAHTGLEVWFEPPSGSVIPQPSRFRMALLLTVVVYLLVLVIGTVATRLVGNAIPAPLRLLVVIAVEVQLMTYVIMPVLTRRLAGWIYPTSSVT